MAETCVCMTLHVSPEKAVPSTSQSTVKLYLTKDQTNVNSVKFKQREHPRPTGPQSQLDRISWATELWNVLDGSRRDLLIHNCKEGLWCDLFVGLASRDQILCQIVTEINKHVSQPLECVLAYCHTEIREKTLEYLTMIDRPAEHRSSDILGRLDKFLQAKIVASRPENTSSVVGKRVSNLNLAADVVAYYETHGLAAAYGQCLNHEKRCPLIPVEDEHGCCNVDPGDDFANEKITFVSSAPPCTDNSRMNKNRLGDGGGTMLASVVGACEMKLTNPVMGYVECTVDWDCGIVAQQLVNHECFKVKLRGHDVGDKYDRVRQVLVCLRHDYALCRKLDEYLFDVQSDPVFDVNQWWSMSEEGEEEQDLMELASGRVTTVPVGNEELSWHDAILPSQQVYLQRYHAKRQEAVRLGKLREGDQVWGDLDQNPFSSWGRLLSEFDPFPTFVKHSTLWHLQQDKPMTALGMARVHGWRISESERSAVGCIVDLYGILKSNRMSCRELKSLIGDSWHLRCQGMFMMWLLSCIQTRSSLTPVHGSPREKKAKIGAHDDDDEDADSTEVGGHSMELCSSGDESS